MERIRDTLKKYGFTFKKSLGQNFITDENLLASVAEAAGTPELRLAYRAGGVTTGNGFGQRYFVATVF